MVVAHHKCTSTKVTPFGAFHIWGFQADAGGGRVLQRRPSPGCRRCDSLLFLISTVFRRHYICNGGKKERQKNDQPCAKAGTLVGTRSSVCSSAMFVDVFFLSSCVAKWTHPPKQPPKNPKNPKNPFRCPDQHSPGHQSKPAWLLHKVIYRVLNLGNSRIVREIVWGLLSRFKTWIETRNLSANCAHDFPTIPGILPRVLNLGR